MQSSMQTTIESTAAFNDLLYLLTGGYLGLFMLGLITMVLFFFLPLFLYGYKEFKRITFFFFLV